MDQNRVRGMLAGHGIGDALGAPHEFDKKQELVYTGSLIHSINRYDRYRDTTKIYPPGSVTDDTGMTMALIRSILSTNGVYDRDTTILTYMRWANGDLDGTTKMGMGKNTRALFTHPYKRDGTANYHKAFNTIFTCCSYSHWTQSNGSLMRCSPFALYDRGAIEMVKMDCMLSNPHPVSQDATMVYVMALWMALRGYDRETTYNTVKSRAQTQEVKDLFTILDNETPYTLSGKAVKGHCLRALYCAIISMKKGLSYKQTVDTFAQLHDTDTDTNAAIAGALIGAFEGFTQMMSNPTTLSNYNIVEKANGIDYKAVTDALISILKV
jgi:ADP-ribosylglycohydrolase